MYRLDSFIRLDVARTLSPARRRLCGLQVSFSDRGDCVVRSPEGHSGDY